MSDAINIIIAFAMMAGVALTRGEAQYEHKGAFYEQESIVAKYAAPEENKDMTKTQWDAFKALAKHLNGRRK